MSDTELTPEQKSDLETWDERARLPPWPSKSRLLSREEFLYLDKLREERRAAAREAAIQAGAPERERRNSELLQK